MNRRQRFASSLIPALSVCILLGACGGGGGGGGEFQIDSINVNNNEVWKINRPISIHFTKPVDFASVNLNTINVRQLGGAPSAGEFFLKDSQTIVFQPLCPTLDDLSDAGLKAGGVTYEIKLLGANQGASSTVRSSSGDPLQESQTRRFTTPVSLLPVDLFFDPKVGPPLPVVRTNLAGDNTQAATYLEIGGDPNNRVYFERAIGGAVTLDPPTALPLNLLSDASTSVVLVLQVNQAVDPSSVNISTKGVRWEFLTTPGVWQPLQTQMRLVTNCTQAGATIRIEPLGVVPPGAQTRVVMTTLFKDLVGDASPLQLDTFALASTQAAPSPLADHFLDEFATAENDDSTAAFLEPHAVVSGGELRAAFSFTGTGGPGGNFDWKVKSGEVFVLNTGNATITGGPNFTETTNLTVVGGTVDLHSMWVQQGGLLIVQGTKPMRILASGTVLIEGDIDLSGTASPGVATLNTPNIPEPGSPGQAGGGQGGTGSPLTTASDPKGGDAFGAFNLPDGGGKGGETGWSVKVSVDARRGGGGGGGRFGHDQLNTAGAGTFDQRYIGLDAEPGFPNLNADNGAMGSTGEAKGGDIGPGPFADGDATNDFYGTQFDVVNQKLIIGELKKPWAGAGGGAGGDCSRVTTTFPKTPYNPQADEKGAGGGGGGGSLEILSLGDITFGAAGTIVCRGGSGGGGENTALFNRVGGGSGGGSGGHVILQTAGVIDMSLVQTVSANDVGIIATGGEGGAGAQDLGGAVQGPNGPKEKPPGSDACPPGYLTTGPNPCKGHTEGAGGDGSPGIIQLHTNAGSVGPPGSGAEIITPIAKTLADICKPTPLSSLGSTVDSFMVPTFGRKSRARSEWIPLGDGGFDASAPATYKDVTFDFGGTDPLTGFVQVDPLSGQVVGQAPLLGPTTLLISPNVPCVDPTDPRKLLIDASSLLGGSQEVLLTDTDLLKHHLIELSQASAPTNLKRFDVVAASYDAGTQVLSLTVDAGGPALPSFVPGGAINVAVLPSSFRVFLNDGTPDFLPPSASVQIMLEATSADPNGLPVEPATRPLTTDFSTLNVLPNNDLRFVRYEVLFDIDAQAAGLTPSNPIPGIDFFKLPFRYQ